MNLIPRHRVLARSVHCTCPCDAHSRLSLMSSLNLADIVDLSKTSLLISLLSITFNPIAWNIVARNGSNSIHGILFGLLTRHGESRIQKQDHHSVVPGK
jgi:hypothetical protein